MPPLLRRSIAVYEAGRVLTAYMTPHYDEVGKVLATPEQTQPACASLCLHCIRPGVITTEDLQLHYRLLLG